MSERVFNDAHETPAPRQEGGRGAGRRPERRSLFRRVAVSRPGEPAEREADRVAEVVLRGSARSHVSRASGDEARERRSFCAPHVARRLRTMRERGAPLSGELRAFFEPRLGHDFGRVRVHTDAAAAEAASELGAVAFAVGNDVAFAAGRYAPETPSGRRLLAHELVHVAQQGDSAAWAARASYGTTGPEPRALSRDEGERAAWNPPEPEEGVATEEEAAEEVALVQRQPPDAGAPDAGTQLATPSLALAPGANLTRGDSLAVSVVFTPTAGETLTVTGWTYETAAHGTVTRPAGDADFQTRWSGVMAVSGDIVFAYRVTPAGGQPAGGPAAPQTLRSSLTVADRTGAPWASVVTQQPEVSFAGQPSPPRQFRQLGRHNTAAPALPVLTTTPIASGPNAQRTYVSALTAGTYTSAPRIHPDLTNASSPFHVFHLDPSRLYLVVGAARTLIPLAEYSGLTVAGGTLSFTVPNWEVFYKRHNFYRVTANTDGGPDVVLPPTTWRLASNAEDADVEITNPAAVRAALGIPATQGFSHAWAPRGRWDGFQLMQAPAILAGTRSHEYVHAVHSHRANFLAMMRALDPQRKIESVVAAPGQPVNFNGKIATWWAEIIRPDHELVDEPASRAAEAFVAGPGTMAGVNTDPASGAFLGSVWDIPGDRQMA